MDGVALDDSDLGVKAALTVRVTKVTQVPDMVLSRDLMAHHQAASLDEARVILRFVAVQHTKPVT
ncbi:hypothetical protein [Neorhizobium sp. NCHU2750]|uniref:hypothetical protein n=1 Tax=Neorhizobium sp. NCHU2750 TaxID=1825976 RepID=UPI000E718470|nr:hypothetical protein NCHU2750_12150 [Neorhizobium sp. NCHU2750]